MCISFTQCVTTPLLNFVHVSNECHTTECDMPGHVLCAGTGEYSSCGLRAQVLVPGNFRDHPVMLLH